MTTAPPPTLSRPSGGAPAREPVPRWGRVALAALTALAAGLHLFRLGAKSLWLDEAVSAQQTLLTWSERWEHVTTHDINMVLHHLLLGAWGALGRSEAWLRLPSVAFAVATVPATYAVGRRLFGHRTGLVAALILVLNPFVLRYGQEARGYAMTMLLAAITSWLLLRVVDRPTWRRVAAWVAVGALLPYSHFFGGLALVGHAAATLPWPGCRHARPQLLAGFAATAVLQAPLAAALATSGDRGQVDWIEPLSALRVAGLFPRLTGDDNVVLAAVVLAAIVAALVVPAREVRARGWASPATWPFGFLLAWVLVPIATAIAISAVKPMFVPRFFIPVVPALAVLAARGVDALPPRWRAGLGAVFVAASLWSLVAWYTGPPEEDWRAATDAVLTAAEPGDGVVFVPQFAREPVEWYGRDDPRLDRLDPVLPAAPWGAYRPSRPEPLPLGFDAGEAVDDLGRVWVVVRGDALDDVSHAPSDLLHALEATHDVAARRSFAGVEVLRYEPAGT